MPLTLDEKKRVSKEVADVAARSVSLVAADYSGLTVADMTQLRVQAREQSVYLRVVKNTLARRALQGTEYECINDALVGPLFLAFSHDAPGAAARFLRDFAKKNEKLQVKAMALGGKLMGPESLDAVANLPTKDEALAKLLYVLKAPVEKFVRTLAEPHAKLVRTLAAVRDKKQAA